MPELRGGARSIHALTRVLLALVLGAVPSASAQPDAVQPAPGGCDVETARRLRFLEQELDAQAGYARRWTTAWNAVYAGGIVVQGTRAGFEDDGGERADLIVAAVKSTIGLARNLASPPSARLGADEVRDVPAGDAASCAARLARAEEILIRNAEESRSERWSPIPHLANLGLNLAGAVIVAEGFDEPSGWTSGALGFAIGEGRIWSHPWQAENTLEEYRRRFPEHGGPASPEARLRLEPWRTGARLVVEF